MIKLVFRPKLILIILSTLLVAAQCGPATPPAGPPVDPPTLTPTPVLIAPIEPGDGSDLIDHLLETGVIRVGIRVWPEATFSPPAFRGFSNAETGGALNGFEVDLARLLAEQLGLELELVEAYPPVIATGDWRGTWDIAIAFLVPFDRPSEPPAGQPQQALFFSRPYAYVPMALLIPAGENEIRSFGDLSGRKVGVLEHSSFQQLLAPAGSLLTGSRPASFAPGSART